MIALAVEQYGLPLEACLAGTGVAAADLTEPGREIAGQQELAVLRNILQALGPGVPFGLEAGLRYRTTTHCMWGFAIMTSANVRQALEVGVRYADLTYSFNQLALEIDERRARLLFDDSDNPDDLRAALVERDWGAFVGLQRDILGGAMPVQALCLRAAKPSYAERFIELFGVAPEFGASVNCLTIGAALLEVAGPFADTLAFSVCDEQCRALVERRRGQAGVSGLVRARLLRRSGEFPSMSTIAVDLAMSPRTLRNRLASEGTSYRDLLEETREALAEELLAEQRLNIDEVASRLGYSERSSFIMAFKRWKGVPPGRYRRS